MLQSEMLGPPAAGLQQNVLPARWTVNFGSYCRRYELTGRSAYVRALPFGQRGGLTVGVDDTLAIAVRDLNFDVLVLADVRRVRDTLIRALRLGDERDRRSGGDAEEGRNNGEN